jgi:uncharacterized membrane protein
MTRGNQSEPDACLAALADATLSAQAAARRLNTAPDADGITKNAIELQLAELRRALDDLTRRLDELPTA